MGCHTWVYEKVDNVPTDEIMFKYFYRCTYETLKNGKILKNGSWELKYHEEWETKTCYKNSSDEIEVTDINKIPEEIRHLFTLNENFTEIPSAECSLFFDETGLYKETNHHDIFRVNNYPEDVIHSYDELKAFVSQEGCCSEDSEAFQLAQTKEETLRIGKEFFANHPNTLIRFG